jgi:hypothetical protein
MKENENNFESLRRLLALKRRETPPPGYFENFSAEVMARVRAGDAGRTGSVSEQLPWLIRLMSAFEAKPAFAGAFASALCLLLVFGIVFAERPDSVTQPLLTPTAQTTPDEILMATATSPSASGLNAQPALQPNFLSSTNPVLNTQLASSQLGGTFFGQPGPMVQQVNFELPGN